MAEHLMRFHVFEFKKADLAAMPDADRRMVILGGHAMNLIGVGVKLLALTINYRSKDAVLDSFNAAQAQILVRSLCGTLVETWRWINRRETHQHLRSYYLADLPAEALTAYHALGRMFGKSGVLTRARDQFSFHFPDDTHLDNAFSATPGEQDFNWYVSDENTSSLYFGCEAVIGYGVESLAGKEVGGKAGMDRVVHEMTAAANAMSDFLGGLLATIVDRHLANLPRSTFQVAFDEGPRPSMPFLLHGVMSPRDPSAE